MLFHSYIMCTFVLNEDCKLDLTRTNAVVHIRTTVFEIKSDL